MLTKAQKSEVRGFLRRQAAYYDTIQVSPSPNPVSCLSWALAFQRVLYHLHQTHHWQTSGITYYSDHLLFERLYSGTLEGIDSIGERAVGSGGPELVDLRTQMTWLGSITEYIYQGQSGQLTVESLLGLSLKAESLFLVLFHKSTTSSGVS